MLLSIPNVVFACLSLVSVGASLSNDDILKMIQELKQEQGALKQEQGALIQEQGALKQEQGALIQDQAGLKKTIDQLVDNEGSSNKRRRLKGGIENKVISGGHRVLKSKSKKYDNEKDRNICYSSDEKEISVFVSCETEHGDNDDDFPITNCMNERRLLTPDEATRNLRELFHGDDDYYDCNEGNSEEQFSTEDSAESSPFGIFPIGAVNIEEDESMMVELTTTTINMLQSSFREIPSLLEGFATSGVYVTVSMWADCDSWATCNQAGATPVLPEPMEWIPIHVVSAEESGYRYGTSLSNSTVEQTTTSKLFFPASKLNDHRNYFMTLEFKLKAEGSADICNYNEFSAVSMFSQSTLGAYVIDAQIIKDADFGNCAWIDPEKSGCGFFDDPKDGVDCA